MQNVVSVSATSIAALWFIASQVTWYMQIKIYTVNLASKLLSNLNQDCELPYSKKDADFFHVLHYGINVRQYSVFW